MRFFTTTVKKISESIISEENLDLYEYKYIIDLYEYKSASNFSLTPPTPMEIMQSILTLKETAAGEEWITANILKECADAIAVPLSSTYLFKRVSSP